MWRKTDRWKSPQSLFDDTLFWPITWPEKTVDLERNSLRDYRQRPLSAQISPAELYHENSKLFPEMMHGLTGALVDGYEVRREFVQRRARQVQSSGHTELTLPAGVRELLSTAARACRAETFYAVETRLVAARSVAVHEPITGALTVIKHLTDSELGRLERALRLTAPPGLPPHGGLWLLLVGYFARNEILLGARGYRRTLVEAGEAAHAILEEASRRGLPAWPIYEFTDQDVDTLMEADGVEVGTVMAFELRGAVNGRQ